MGAFERIVLTLTIFLPARQPLVHAPVLQSGHVVGGRSGPPAPEARVG